MRRSLLALALFLAACGTRPCREHTVLLTLHLAGAALDADTLSLAVSIGGSAKTLAASRRGREDETTVEIDFDDGYPRAASLQVEIDALAQGMVVGHGAGTAMLGNSCTALDIDIGAPPDQGAPLDASTVDAASFDAGPDLAGCGVLYVAGTTGDDANDGCSTAAPLRTIAHAEAVRVADQAVHVCRGTYAEAPLAVRGVLQGGYSCSSWARTSGYGYPNFTAINETLITAGPDVTTTVTMDEEPGHASILDGFTLEGAPTGTMGSVTLLGHGRIVVSNNKLYGGGTSNSLNGTVAVHLDGAADFHDNFVDGGSGTTTGAATGSIGLLWDGAPIVPTAVAHIHGNTILGGHGTSPDQAFGAIGLVISGSGQMTLENGTALERNVVSGGQGTSPGTTQGNAGATGMLLAGAVDIDVVGNIVDGGSSALANTYGIQTFTEGALRIYANKIYAGSGNGTVGINVGSVTQIGTAVVESNMVLGGPTQVGRGSDVVYVALKGTRVVHNTLVASNEDAASAHPLVHLGSGGQLSDIVVDDNILAGSGSQRTHAVLADSQCAKDALASLRSNVSFYTSSIVKTAQTGGCSTLPTDQYTSDQALQADFDKATVTGNLNLDKTCAGDSGCVPVTACDSPSHCLSALVLGWDVSTNGLTTLTTGVMPGWQLTSAAPCAVTRAAYASPTAFFADAYGVTWPAMPSMGAAERDGTCAP